jgi:hypothetical protein
VKIGAPPPADFRGEAAFVSRNGAPAPETWDPDGAVSIFHEVLPHQLPRGSALKT